MKLTLDFGDLIMSALTEKLDTLEIKIDDATQKVAAETGILTGKLDELSAKIDDLTAQLEANATTPAELARLDDLTAKVDAIAPTV